MLKAGTIRVPAENAPPVGPACYLTKWSRCLSPETGHLICQIETHSVIGKLITYRGIHKGSS
jgi:hypothetical protein